MNCEHSVVKLKVNISKNMSHILLEKIIGIAVGVSLLGSSLVGYKTGRFQKNKGPIIISKKNRPFLFWFCIIFSAVAGIYLIIFPTFLF
mgnify:CR=1 FL=1